MMGLFTLIISFGCLCKFLSGVQGTSCVSSCNGIANGDYQSCLGCTVYATCSNGILYDNRPCPASLVWDDILKRCEYTSSTCPVTSSSTMTTPPTTTTPTTTTPPPTTTTQNPCSDCCVEGELNLNLTSNSGTYSGYLPGVYISQNISGPLNNFECSRGVVIAADFDKITSNGSCDGVGCFTTPPICGKRMLKIELHLSSGTRSGRIFNVGDSATNDGFGGDGSTQQNDAEVDLLHPNALIYPSDKCLPYTGPRFRADDVTASFVNKVTFYIGNEYVRIDAQGQDVSFCDECLFALNGQSDSSIGGRNERVFIGINRIVRNLSRRGVGVCSARLTWNC